MQTQSLALVIDDPDAVGGRYVHWVVTGIPPSTTEIVDGALPAGAVASANSGGNAAYLGPCPTAGTGVHHYRFQLYALSKTLVLAPTTPAGQATQTIAGATLATAGTVGLFSGWVSDPRWVVPQSTADTSCGPPAFVQQEWAFANCGQIVAAVVGRCRRCGCCVVVGLDEPWCS